jgi:hypothetical protein
MHITIRAQKSIKTVNNPCSGNSKHALSQIEFCLLLLYHFIRSLEASIWSLELILYNVISNHPSCSLDVAATGESGMYDA